mmetsp:Transcript_17478/g.46581  ORF Transcript_17478/g.46581 Transcript_17478/m.46581 type:complete len:229 (-) Transcript_17478:541-1227(-)
MHGLGEVLCQGPQAQGADTAAIVEMQRQAGQLRGQLLCEHFDAGVGDRLAAKEIQAQFLQVLRQAIRQLNHGLIIDVRATFEAQLQLFQTAWEAFYQATHRCCVGILHASESERQLRPLLVCAQHSWQRDRTRVAAVEVLDDATTQGFRPSGLRKEAPQSPVGLLELAISTTVAPKEFENLLLVPLPRNFAVLQLHAHGGHKQFQWKVSLSLPLGRQGFIWQPRPREQ